MQGAWSLHSRETNLRSSRGISASKYTDFSLILEAKYCLKNEALKLSIIGTLENAVKILKNGELILIW